MAFGHFLLGSHNSMVTALGSCGKWPLVSHLELVNPKLLEVKFEDSISF